MSPIVPITEVEQLRGRGRDTQGKKATNKNRLRVMPPGSLAIASNRMRQQKKPSAAQRAVTAIQKVPSAVQKEQPVQAATPVQEPPSQAATLVQAPPSQAAAPVNTPPPTTTSEAFRFIRTPGFTLSRQFQQGPPQHTTQGMERDHRHQEDEQEHEEGNQEVDEEGEIEKDGEEDNHDKDTCGKVIIRPMGNGFTPAVVAAVAIRRVIEKTFPNNITCYSEVKDEARKVWFERFKKIVAWEPHHEHVIKANFHRNCGKRLTDIFTKLRKKDKKPDWMNGEGWKYLNDRWKEDDFKIRSERMKINRASSKGGALHTTGRKAHHDIALDMNAMLGRPVHPDELFVATHKKRNGEWVDRRSEKTHNDYQVRMTQATQTDDGATSVTQEVDGSKRIEIWKDVSGGKSRGGCYGVGHLAPNLRHGVTHLTYEADAHHIRVENQKIEAARAEAARARADAEAAKADAAAARAEAAAANANFKSLETKLEEFQRRMMAFESGSCSGHSRQSSHPHYDNELDDQSVDEEEDDGL
ncbi:hypothetical protein P8452_56748 [Trifolium repens]|nr:hypothetical protein P8452_56748 [Trifolium repens]